MKCKCEHWQECPTCTPHRFDAAGKLKPPKPTLAMDGHPAAEYWRQIEAVHAAMLAEIDRLRRWKSTHAPRIEALEGLLRTAQAEAHAGREAVATLASERAANAVLTTELEAVTAAERDRCAQIVEDMVRAVDGADALAAIRKPNVL